MYRQGYLDHHEPAQAVRATADSTGVATNFLGPVAAGYCWYVERISSHAPSSATTLEVFVAQATGVTEEGVRMDFAGAGVANDGISDEHHAIFVPSGYFLNFRWAAAAQNDQCVASVQIAVHKLGPADYALGHNTEAQVEAFESAADRQQSEPHGHALPSPGFDRIEGKLV